MGDRFSREFRRVFDDAISLRGVLRVCLDARFVVACLTIALFEFQPENTFFMPVWKLCSSSR